MGRGAALHQCPPALRLSVGGDCRLVRARATGHGESASAYLSLARRGRQPGAGVAGGPARPDELATGAKPSARRRSPDATGRGRPSGRHGRNRHQRPAQRGQCTQQREYLRRPGHPQAAHQQGLGAWQGRANDERACRGPRRLHLPRRKRQTAARLPEPTGGRACSRATEHDRGTRPAE
ncbi:hypothetical protein D3C76_1255880 [compost metagenome]